MKITKGQSLVAATTFALTMLFMNPSLRAQDIAWGPATGITGDVDLVTNGVYVDALLPNPNSPSALEVDGITFNLCTVSNSPTTGSDGIISYDITVGNNNAYEFTTFPVAPPSSPAFAAVMNAGGTYENSGAGAGIVTISGLMVGHVYSVQVFNYANDGDDGYTTLSGSTPVTIGNLPGLAGPGTYGEFATGEFTATGSTETFNWAGAGSTYTVLGAISVQDISVVVQVTPGLSVFQGDTVTLSAVAQSTQPVNYEWLTDNGSGGSTWAAITGATASNYVFNASTLNPGTYEYEVVVSNALLYATSAPVVLDVSQSSFPVLTEDVSPATTNEYVGGSVTFTVAFNGNHPITNQWQFTSDDGTNFVDIPNATNAVLNLTDLQLTNSGGYRCVASNAFGGAESSVGTLTVYPALVENIAWGPATGITGDADLVTNGIYFDAFIPNPDVVGQAAFVADGVAFNGTTSTSSTTGTDGKISFQITTGDNNAYSFNSFPTASPSSPALAAVMDAGGTFEFGGDGAGIVTISGLTIGHAYTVQVFNYAADGDDGLTTLSGSTPVTIGNLPGLAGAGTYGEFATGSFTATTPNEAFNWTGDGSSYTVLGAISVMDTTVTVTATPGLQVFSGENVALTAVVTPNQAVTYAWLTNGGSGGVTWTAIPGANSASYDFSASTLAPGTYEYEVAISNTSLVLTSAPVWITVSAASFPVLTQDISPLSTNEYVGQSITYTVAFVGNSPITNQWQFSTDLGATFQNILDATNATFTLSDLQLTNAGEYRCVASNALGSASSSAASLSVVPAPAENIAWGSVVGITGDADLVTNGVYFDAFLDNTGSAVVSGGALTADGITFNTATSSSTTGGTDGKITFTVSSGANNNFGFTTFPTTPPSSPAFAAIMNSGGTYQDGGAGAGEVTIIGLTAGHIYSVQVFNFAADGDDGYTTLSGSSPVTIGNLPGLAGPGTYGEVATGRFVASSGTEVFHWNGAGSAYTVLGPISVVDVTGVTSVTPPSVAFSTSGGLSLSWSADHIGWRLEGQTNGLSSTNWATVVNSTLTNGASLEITTNGSVFFRLVYP
jgi:hypothetical protein